MTSDHRTSLRGLARRCGCTHSALVKAIALGRLTAGIAVGARGQTLVVDAAAAEEQWRQVHVDVLRMDGRRRPAVGRQSTAPPPQALFDDLSRQDLLETWAAFDLLAHALVADTLAGGGAPDALVERVLAQLWRIAPDHGADELTLANALELLRELVTDRAAGAAEPPL